MPEDSGVGGCCKREQDNFWGQSVVISLGCGGGYMGLCICENFQTIHWISVYSIADNNNSAPPIFKNK